MLSFDTALSNSLKLGNTTSFWVLKLYYNAEGSSDFIGVSEQDRLDGSDMYYGLVASWGEYQQSLDFFNFTTNTGNMSVKLINTDNSIQGGRFTDLFATKNFANRKWELFQNTSQTSTYDTSARMIGQGVISGDIKYDTKGVTLTLLDLNDKYHKQIPTAVIQNTESGDDHYYPNAPEKNINKPIPMAYGDFHDKTGIGTVPSIFNPAFQKGQFPAIITNNMDEDDGYVYANADSETLHTLDTSNIYIYNDGHFSSCNSANTALSNPQLKYKGTSWYAFIPVNVGSIGGNVADGNFGTNYQLEVVAGGSDSLNISIPEVPNLGDISSVDVIVEYGSYDLVDIDFFEIFNANAMTGSTPDNVVQIQSGGDWDFDRQGIIYLESEFSGGDIEIEEMYIRVTFSPNKLLTKHSEQFYERRNPVYAHAGVWSYALDFIGVPRTVTSSRTISKSVPTDIDYIYYSGKGRKYGTWINLRTTYSNTDFIENPIYIIESMIRTELGLTNIDSTSFDASGNTTNGHLGDILDDSVSQLYYAMSQYKFISSKDFIEKIGQQCLSWVFLSGDGNFKIKTLRRVGDYSSSDKTIDYREINLNSISRTKLGAVRNDITINYNHDYGQDQNLSHVNTTDATSIGTGVDGVGDALKLELDADAILDDSTATQFADAYLQTFKDRKPILDFVCKVPKYNDLEIGDIVDFSNWDSNIDIYGDAMGGYWMVTDISKAIKKTTIKVIKVSTL